MTVDDKIRDDKPQYNISRYAAKISALWSDKVDKYEYPTSVKTLSSDQSRIIEQARFTYSPLVKAFEKCIKTIESQVRKQDKFFKVFKTRGKSARPKTNW